MSRPQAGEPGIELLNRIGNHHLEEVESKEPEVSVEADEIRDEYKNFRGRHIQMMALGASIGTGMLFESGYSLSIGGPVSLLLAYLWTASILYAVMTTLGEMISFLPVPGGPFTLANRVLTSGLGFAAGYAYCLGYALDYPSKAIAAAGFIEFWTTAVSQQILVTIFLVIPIGFNLLNLRRYGEIEFWLTTIKVVMIVLLIVLGVLLPMGASPRTPLLGTGSNYRPVDCSQNVIGECIPSHGFNYWREAAFKPFLDTGVRGCFTGFWECACRAVFTFTGNEIIGITADETERQRDTIPKATKRITSRIIFYYVGAVLVLGLNLSADDPILPLRVDNDPAKRYPGGFIVMLQRANIPVLPSIVNAVMVIAALSVENVDIYVTSRCLYALSREGQSFKFFTRKNRLGVPWVAVLVASLPGVLAYMGLAVVSTNAFGFLSSTVSILVVWATICLTYLRLRRAIGKQRVESLMVPEARSRLQPYVALYGFICSSLFVLFYGFKAFTRNNVLWSQPGNTWSLTLAPYAFLGLFIALFLTSRLIDTQSWKFVALRKVDLMNGVAPKIKSRPRESVWWKRGLEATLDLL